MSQPPIPLPACDVLALGPHPDDIEIGNAGTLLLLRQAGQRLALLDLTRGEKGSRGTVDERNAEAEAATRRLGAAVRLDQPLCAAEYFYAALWP